MAFDLQVHNKNQRGRGAASGVSFVSRRSRKDGPSYAIMVVNEDVARTLAWGVGTRLTMQLGRGRDFGRVRVRADADGQLTCRRLNNSPGSKQLTVAVTVLGDGSPHSIVRVEHQLATGALFVTLPEWALPQARSMLTQARASRREAA